MYSFYSRLSFGRLLARFVQI